MYELDIPKHLSKHFTSLSTSVFDLEIEKFGKYLQRNMEKYSKYSNIELKLEWKQTLEYYFRIIKLIPLRQ